MEQGSGDAGGRLEPGELPGAKPEQLAGAGADAGREQADLAGLAVLENDGRAITVAAYAGDRYRGANEMARVRIGLAGRGAEARITEIGEAPPARGSTALAAALGQAERMAAQLGVRRLECRIPEADFARLDPTERRDIAQALHDRGYVFAGAAGTELRSAGAATGAGVRSLEASKELEGRPARPVEPPRSPEVHRAGITPGDGEQRLEAPAGLQILEETREGITVAAYAGARYSISGEVARVRLEYAPPGAPPVARVAEFALARPEACDAGKDALDLAVARARQQGVSLVEFRIAEREFTARPLPERVALIRSLQEDWSQVLHETRLPNGERQLIGRPGAPEVVGEPLWLDAKKDLTAEHPPALERLDRASAAQFCAELAQALDGQPPAELHLPPAVEARLEELWRWSMAQPERPEWAATLVVDQAGDLVAAHPVTGVPIGVTPEAPGPGEELIGYLHIHPYESGLTDMAFSGQDLASFLRESGDIVEVVRSGDGLFALVKTRASHRIGWLAAGGVARSINQEFGTVRDSLAELEGRADSDLNAQLAAIAVNEEMCARYGVALYAGKAGRPLQRIYP